MIDEEIKEYLMCDYIYLPYENKDSLNLSNTEIIKGESI